MALLTLLKLNRSNFQIKEGVDFSSKLLLNELIELMMPSIGVKHLKLETHYNSSIPFNVVANWL